ncbi:Osmotically-inducible lipoprotein OsmB, partial [Salmonella enterica subsp. enterica serovar Kentucky]
VYDEQKNGRCCAGNHRSNVSERLLKLVQARSQHGYWRRCGGVRRRSVNGRQYIRHPGRRGGRRRDWSPGWKI